MDGQSRAQAQSHMQWLQQNPLKHHLAPGLNRSFFDGLFWMLLLVARSPPAQCTLGIKKTPRQSVFFTSSLPKHPRLSTTQWADAFETYKRSEEGGIPTGTAQKHLQKINPFQRTAIQSKAIAPIVLKDTELSRLYPGFTYRQKIAIKHVKKHRLRGVVSLC